MPESIEVLLMIVAAIIVAVIAAVSMKGITQGNADNAAEKARTSFGKNVKFTLVETGTQTAYVYKAKSAISVDSTEVVAADEYYANITLTFTDLVNVDNKSYVRIQVMGDSLYKWELAAVYYEQGSNKGALKASGLSFAAKLEEFGTYEAGKDFRLGVLVKSKGPVATEDRIVLGVSLGDAPAQNVEVKLVPVE